MGTQQFSKKEFEENYEIKFYGLLGLKPTFKTDKHERYLTYCLILDDLIQFNRLDMIITIKYKLHKNVLVDDIFKELIDIDKTSLMNNYKEIIMFYSNEDITEKFF